jgi:hypothetical protein
MNRNSCSASNELRLASCAWSSRYRTTSSLPRNRGGGIYIYLIPSTSRREPRRNTYFVISRPWLLWNRLGCFSCVSAAIYSPHPPFRSCYFTAPFFIFYIFFWLLVAGFARSWWRFLLLSCFAFSTFAFFSPPFSFLCAPSGRRGAYCWMTAYGCRFDDLTLLY